MLHTADIEITAISNAKLKHADFVLKEHEKCPSMCCIQFQSKTAFLMFTRTLIIIHVLAKYQ